MGSNSLGKIQQIYCFPRPDRVFLSKGKTCKLVVRSSEGKIILPISNCPVKVAWPMLDNDKYEY